MSSVLEILNACLSAANKNQLPFKNFDAIAPGAYLVNKFLFDKKSKYGIKVIAVTKEFKINFPKRATEEFYSQERVDVLNKAAPLVMVFGGKDGGQGNLIRAAFIAIDHPAVSRYNVIGMTSAAAMEQDEIDGISDNAVDYCYEVENTLKEWKI